MDMSLRHNIHKKCTDHTYGTCASCGFIAASPWSEYLREVPFEKQLEIIEMEEEPFGRVLAAPEGIPPYLAALMKDAEMYPVDTLVPDSVPENSMTYSVESLEKKQELSSVSVSYNKKYGDCDRKKRSSKKKDTRSRKKHSWKKAHCKKRCVESDDFLIPKTDTIPKYRKRIRKWCRCCNSIVKMGRNKIVCNSCRKDRCYHCGTISEVTPICTDCEFFLTEIRGIVTDEDIMSLKQEWLKQSFTYVKRQPKYELCHCGFYYRSSLQNQECKTCEEEHLMEERAERRRERRR